MFKRVMFITAINIFDSTGGGGVKASLEHLRLLQTCCGKENVQVCACLMPKEMVVTDSAKIFKREDSNFKLLIAALFGCKVYLPWHEKDIVQFINVYSPDLLVVDFSLLGRLIRLKHSYKTIVFYHNIEADYALNKVKKEGVFYIPSYWASKMNDRWAAKADRVICLNRRDSNRLNECYGRKADLLIPITFKDDFDQSRTVMNYKKEILFLGTCFPPNQYSIEWFITEVMPLLHNITLNIVGKGFEEKKEEYEQHENVRVIGTVQELAPYYYAHCAVVQPIKYGAGMKVKTAEAMMYGRRIFASDEALEGYDVDGISGITRCNTAIEYADAINKYFEIGDFKSYEKGVRNLFLEKYETGQVVAKFRSLLDEMT
ncbi:MAG: glycosyltransferase [Lachnospiraceae bacterium]|nr:glycosyltransferase [Lachnospiraceae bacterium]